MKKLLLSLMFTTAFAMDSAETQELTFRQLEKKYGVGFGASDVLLDEVLPKHNMSASDFRSSGNADKYWEEAFRIIHSRQIPQKVEDKKHTNARAKIDELEKLAKERGIKIESSFGSRFMVFPELSEKVEVKLENYSKIADFLNSSNVKKDEARSQVKTFFDKETQTDIMGNFENISEKEAKKYNHLLIRFTEFEKENILLKGKIKELEEKSVGEQTKEDRIKLLEQKNLELEQQLLVYRSRDVSYLDKTKEILDYLQINVTDKKKSAAVRGFVSDFKEYQESKKEDSAFSELYKDITEFGKDEIPDIYNKFISAGEKPITQIINEDFHKKASIEPAEEIDWQATADMMIKTAEDSGVKADYSLGEGVVKVIISTPTETSPFSKQETLTWYQAKNDKEIAENIRQRFNIVKKPIMKLKYND